MPYKYDYPLASNTGLCDILQRGVTCYKQAFSPVTQFCARGPPDATSSKFGRHAPDFRYEFSAESLYLIIYLTWLGKGETSSGFIGPRIWRVSDCPMMLNFDHGRKEYYAMQGGAARRVSRTSGGRASPTRVIDNVDVEERRVS